METFIPDENSKIFFSMIIIGQIANIVLINETSLVNETSWTCLADDNMCPVIF